MQRGRGQEQALVGEVPGKELVVAPVAVDGSADDGVIEVLEMEADQTQRPGLGWQQPRPDGCHLLRGIRLEDL